MSEVLKCCPFCGSHEVQICRTNAHACWVRCEDCGGESESDATRRGAIANWNRRYHDDEPAKITEDDDRPSVLPRAA